MKEKQILHLFYRIWCIMNIIGGILAIVFYFIFKWLFALIVGCIVVIVFIYLLTSKSINKIFK